MKSLIRICALLLSCPLVGLPGELRLEITDPPSEGQFRILVFDSATAFSGFRDPYLTETFPVSDTIVVSNLPNAELAWLLYYDENANGFLDENFIGIPKEPLALSNGYFPKGPPNYQAARIILSPEEPSTERITLRRPLGKRGRIGLGVGMLARGSLYEGFSGAETQVIPAITYFGERIQIFGPGAKVGLYGAGDVRLALAGNLEFGAYDEDDSPAFEGLGDRETTLFLGPALSVEGPQGLDMSLQYQHDVLDRIGGGQASVGIDKSFQAGRFSASPGIGVNWMSQDVAQHFFGVPAEKARDDRPAFALEDEVSLEVGLGLGIYLRSNSQLILRGSYEIFDSELADSPIVDRHELWQSFAALVWVF